MRNQVINTKLFWAVYPVSTTELLDGDGFDTGEKIKVYSSPVQVRLTVYPSNGAIIEQIFGKDAQVDLVGVTTSNELIPVVEPSDTLYPSDVIIPVDPSLLRTERLVKDTLLFVSQPSDNFMTTYDYKISNVKRSLNTFQFGLRSRV